MRPFWILYNSAWSNLLTGSIEYPTKEAAIKAALDLKNQTGRNYYIMQPVGTTAPPPVDVELSKEEYSATPNEMRERETQEGEEKEISPPKETEFKG